MSKNDKAYFPTGFFLNLNLTTQAVTTLLASGEPNQSLKLTEVAVDDFAAREKLFKGKAMSVARIVYD